MFDICKDFGKVVATEAVWNLIDSNDAFRNFVSVCLSRYMACDWGDTDDEGCEKNDEAVLNGGRVMAVYRIPDEIPETFEDQIWFFTEADRSQTTLMFMGEF